jgi:hypothetical protein
MAASSLVGCDGSDNDPATAPVAAPPIAETTVVPSDDWAELRTKAVAPVNPSDPADQGVIQVQIRYRHSRAGEVQCVWGLNDFTLVPKQLPPGSFLTYNDSHVNTPMQRDEDVFAVDFEVPANTKLDYAFMITRTRAGQAVRIWAGEPGTGGAYYSRALTIADADEKSVDAETPSDAAMTEPPSRQLLLHRA